MSKLTALSGLRSRPLASYLAALGVLRLVAEQDDPAVRGSWRAGRFRLHSPGGEDDLRSFFLDRYRPTPLVAPWNGSNQGGFRTGSDDRAAGLLTWLEGHDDPRLDLCRTVVERTRQVVATPRWQAANTAKDKVGMVVPLRNALPDTAIPFLDAAVALTADGIAYPPIFGTGGNIGRLDLVINFWEHLQRILAPSRGDHPDAWLEEALFDVPAAGVRSTPGQFDYHGVGGVNAARAGFAPERVNPWTYVLTVEGALCFAATATRRLGAQRSRASAPFTVAPTPAGYASATVGESAKGEMWMPLWSRPWSAEEVRSVLGEGRATWGDRQARDGTDFLRAMRTLGVDRGIDAFERYAFLERNGQSPAAIPVGQVKVAEEPKVRLTRELDGWVNHLNRGSDDRVPAAVRTARNRVNQALFTASDRPTRDRFLALLGAVAEAERAVAVSSSFRAATGIGPVPELSLAWIDELTGPEDEFAVARLLTAGHDRWDRQSAAGRPERSLREFLRPVVVNGYGRISGFRPSGTTVPGLGTVPVVTLLAQVAVLRARSGPVVAHDERAALRGVRVQFPVAPVDAPSGSAARDPRAPMAVVERLANGQLDGHRLATWIDALLLVGPSRHLPAATRTRTVDMTIPSPPWRMLAPWFGSTPLRPASGTSPGDGEGGSDGRSQDGSTAPEGSIRRDGGGTSTWRLVPVVRPSWPARIRRPGGLATLGREVRSAYAAAGLQPAFDPAAVAAGPPRPAPDALLAALLVPTRLRDLADLATTHVRIDQGAQQ